MEVSTGLIEESVAAIKKNVKPTAVLGASKIGEPGVGTTQTFLTIGNFDTRQEAVACQKYINTKFARAMLLIKKATQHNSPDTWEFVPMQDFSANSDIDWTKPLGHIDWQLYTKYKLELNEIAFIERNIKYRDDLPQDWYGGAEEGVQFYFNEKCKSTS